MQQLPESPLTPFRFPVPGKKAISLQDPSGRLPKSTSPSQYGKSKEHFFLLGEISEINTSIKDSVRPWKYWHEGRQDPVSGAAGCLSCPACSSGCTWLTCRGPKVEQQPRGVLTCSIPCRGLGHSFQQDTTVFQALDLLKI